MSFTRALSVATLAALALGSAAKAAAQAVGPPTITVSGVAYLGYYYQLKKDTSLGTRTTSTFPGRTST
jgi:hypothetical protein